MKLCIVGLGYMGLPTALLLSKAGHSVIGYDTAKNKLELLKKGELPFSEKGLKELYGAGRDNFSVSDKIEPADAYVVAVPTPANEDKTCDLRYVISAMESLVQFVKKGVIVILESTVQPGTTTGPVREVLEKSGLKAGRDFSLAYVSEKAIPGDTINEMINNDRIVGGIDEASSKLAAEIYLSFVKGNIHTTDCTTAEVVKLAENAFRDVNIAFANELARICEQIGISVWEVIELANNHPRVSVHLPGLGVGGHCIAIDPWFLTEKYGNNGIIGTARNINEETPNKIVGIMESIVKSKIRVAILGAAYKKNVDDFRESPTIRIAQICAKRGHEYKITDPLVSNFPEKLFSFDEAVKDANVVLVAVDHDIFKAHEPSLSELQRKGIYILDARNLFKGKFPRLGVKQAEFGAK